MPGEDNINLNDLLGSWGGKPDAGFSKQGNKNPVKKDTTPKVPADNPACKNTGITDEGIEQSSRWKSLLSAAIMVYNTANSLRMARLQRDLAKKYLKMSEEHRERYNNAHKPLEKDLVREALKLPKYKRDKEQLYTGQMLTSVRGKNAGQIDKALSCTGRYCTGLRAAIMTDQLLKQATQESLVAGMAHRYTDKEEITHNNLRWEKREQVLKIGRDIPTQAASFAQLAAGIFGDLGTQAGKAAEGAMSFIAYESNRQPTMYPPRRGDMQVSSYRYNPTPLEEFKPKPPDVYVKPEEPAQTIKVMG